MPTTLIGAGVIAVFLTSIIALGIASDRHERDLIRAGLCKPAMEALYTPPPSLHTSCTGSGQAQFCSTWASQADPYLRTLWRCGGEHPEEFWRRSEGN